MRKPTFIFILLLCCTIQGYAQEKSILLGQSITVTSEVLNESREIYIYLPASYQNSTNKYPVIYLLDADTHFKYTAGILDFFTRTGRIPESILIGIPNTNRNRDFTPTVSKDLPASGGADNFLRFLDKELMPYVDQNYRTHPYRTMIGHSLCGMFSFYTMLSRPDLFNSFIAISPWFIYDNNYIFTYSEPSLERLSSLNKFIYFTGGTAEQENVVQSINKFSDLLRQKAPKDLRWSYKLMEGDDHNSLIFMTIYDGLTNLYDGWRVPDSVLRKGLEPIEDHFDNLSERFGYKIIPSEVFLNAAGYYFLQHNNFPEAIKIFDRNVDLYPLSSNVYDSRGEAFERSGNLKEAKENYKNACDIAEKNGDPNLNIFRNNLNRVNNLLQN